jgi:nucleoside-diphosphate-sugar epimerase
MRIVVTGALGHIGSRLIRDLPAAFPRSEIVMVDNLATQRHASLLDLPAGAHFRFIEADILTADLPDLIDGADAVVHLAAVTDAAGSFAAREQVERVNFEGTELIARACARVGVPLLFPSSTSVYGTQGGTVDEDCADLRPQSPYAESKLASEKLLQRLGATQGLHFVSCRLGTIFGTSPGMRYHTAVNKFCWQAATGQPLTVWRDAMQQNRPYLDLGDATRAVMFILRHRLFDRRIYNVLTLNATVARVTGIISARVPDMRIKLVDTPLLNQSTYTVACERFRQAGFEFGGDLERGIDETLRMLGSLPRQAVPVTAGVEP